MGNLNVNTIFKENEAINDINLVYSLIELEAAFFFIFCMKHDIYCNGARFICHRLTFSATSNYIGASRRVAVADQRR